MQLVEWVFSIGLGWSGVVDHEIEDRDKSKQFIPFSEGFHVAGGAVEPHAEEAGNSNNERSPDNPHESGG